MVLKHLDGRGIHVQHPQPTARVLEPGQVIKVAGEGMPYKKSDLKGDLYLVIKVKFPEYAWLAENQAFGKLQELLPKPENPIHADDVDDVAYDDIASCESCFRLRICPKSDLTVCCEKCLNEMYYGALLSYESIFCPDEEMLIAKSYSGGFRSRRRGRRNMGRRERRRWSASVRSAMSAPGHDHLAFRIAGSWPWRTSRLWRSGSDIAYDCAMIKQSLRYLILRIDT